MNGALTQKELSVVRLVAKGKTNQEIGNELCISTATVKAHLVKINLKLGTRNRTEAVYRTAKSRTL